MTLLTLQNAQLAFGHHALLNKTSFSLDAGERVGLVGRNGSGKSSLLKILAGIAHPDDGIRQVGQGGQVAYVAQEPAFATDITVFDAVALGLAPVIALHRRYAQTQDPAELDRLQTQIENSGGWNWEQRVREAIQRLGLSEDSRLDTLSGGQRKRIALAQGLVTQPEVLLLDEPTNHLDIDAIRWLEDLLLGYRGSVVVISHDRAFLNRVTTRIVELDRGVLRSFPGSYDAYRALKEEQLAQESVISAKADKLLAQEEVWVRKGVEARRTRSQSRVARLEALRAQRAQRRTALGAVQMALTSGREGEYQGRIVAELTDVSKAFGAKTVARHVSLTVLRGDKVALLGPNGVGKTTLLRMILGTLEPDAGQVRRGNQLQVAYFDQMRDALDLNATLEEFISPGSEWIEIGAQRKHVRSYLSDFLFDAARARSPVHSLSGGERSRLLLARLFARPANVLVLDEPTNDLDIETLELLEDLLADYDGTVFLVSHDRAFVDGVATSTIAYEGNGQWTEYEGGMNDWLAQSARRAALRAPTSAPSPALQENAPMPTEAASRQRRKLGYREQRELDSLPGQIEALEAEQRDLEAALADGTLYASDHTRAAQYAERLGEVEEALMVLLERWTELSDMASGAQP